MDAKSYVLMQQTCRAVKAFIQHSANIQGIHVDGKFCIEWSDGYSWQLYYYPARRQRRCVPVNGLIGFRLNGLNFYQINSSCAEWLSGVLRAYNVGCDHLTLCTMSGDRGKENIMRLLNNLKPRAVTYFENRMSESSDVLDSIFQGRNFVKSIKVVSQDPNKILNMAKLLLPSFPEVFIFYDCRFDDSGDCPLKIALTGISGQVLDYFFSNEWPNLKSFHFLVANFNEEDHMVEFGRNNVYPLDLALPKQFPDGCICKQVTGGQGNDTFYKISYLKNQ